MLIPLRALEELETAEVAIMSHLGTISRTPAEVPDEDLPDALPMLLAVLRAISTARGLVEAQKMIEEMTVQPSLEVEHCCHHS